MFLTAGFQLDQCPPETGQPASDEASSRSAANFSEAPPQPDGTISCRRFSGLCKWHISHAHKHIWPASLFTSLFSAFHSLYSTVTLPFAPDAFCGPLWSSDTPLKKPKQNKTKIALPPPPQKTLRSCHCSKSKWPTRALIIDATRTRARQSFSRAL